MGAGTQALVIALISALLAGTPALIWAIIRSKRVGPAEEDELVSRAASQAVAAMNTTLEAAVNERKALIEKVSLLERQVARCHRRVSQLEGVVRANGIEIPASAP